MTEIDDAPAPVLPRELTEISDEVRAVPAPPTPTLGDPYEIRLVDPDRDSEMISEWMNRPHLVEAWEYPWPPERFHRYLSAQLAGEYSRPFIGSFRGQPFVYIELYRAAKDSIAPRYDADPHDIGMHAAIAELRFVNRGIAPILLPRLTANIFELDPQCRRIMFDPDYRNTGARGVCEYAGCEFLGEHDMSNRRMALYALHRDR
ncbi:acetyltransferase, ribosomal protein N-acetylase [Mycolicibacterium phlei]|jgi:RimJ/RimL family protein N-acetyltransferase|uniref:Lysine N-acyltransferase MbtK n=1 Tax=Mycolicibacterium phlei DSM 43239 = CCUG 21000 TaxID=1226750 RepID=A0A5N5UPE5_MYCPH|nr:GNAT family N-acetyltransferase [Mycolicibacterium phlei]VEG08777.1 acetyltransferase, ribosomal protein N-acetylase [Mycobacteroides chelonae]AMO60659.1 Lysine N-acyltransferase MbtK [Mycolicibacterium phlei]EID13230.1 acetyltransferase, ribosomal protein N-acetylase [Mycolicibacterium phlei RIVM601174]KAB7751462.1 siderophore biosynthesis protein [Mycolicibacterium phlei DSM 43239 = CCUG 21000]KXW68103.1 siderophore biosynthesis protein [Mycolicibacterium phlei DSM 43239 = CCUG 21000]